MYARHLLLALLLMAALPGLSFGQNRRVSKTHLNEKYGHFTNPDSTLDHRNYFAAMGEKMGLPDASAMVLQQEIPGENGFTHFKFQQFHAGLPIVGSTYILHEKNGWVRKANGHFTPNPAGGATPSITPERAVKVAQQEMKAKTYGNLPAPTLCFIDPAYPKTSEGLRLVYKADLQSLDPFDKQRYYVDAVRGKVVAHFPLIAEQGVPSTAATKYYGNVNITTDSLGPQDFVLRDPTRGTGISVVNVDLKGYQSSSSHWDLKNGKQDEVALDAHYCSTRFYDMMLGDYGWKGLDGNGLGFKAQVHNNFAGNVNAFWDGEYINFGDGDCLNGPLTTMEVVGHELTHGVVSYTSNLVYESESGAMNESLADMFGKALERKADPANFSWDLGHSFIMSPDVKPFRVMDDPKVLEMPAFYGGEFWDPTNDVHVNSSIGNLWFSMIVDGKQGVNEASETFNVPALGMGKGSQIAFSTNKNYLTETSDYNDFYLNSLDAAEEIYGIGAPEKLAVKEAWKAVGLPSSGSGTGPDFDLSVSSQGFDEPETCSGGAYLPITIDIANVGQQPYLPSLGASVTLTALDQLDYTFDLTEAIQPGEVLSVTIDDWFLPTVPQSYFVDIEMDVPDDEPFNNFTYAFFTLHEYAASDLDLYAYLESATCFSPEQVASFYVYNESCAPIPAGSTLNLSIENSSGDVLWSKAHVLAEELPAFGYEYITYPASLAASPQEELTSKVGFASDPDLTNNQALVYSSNIDGITSDYLNKFSNDTELNNLLQPSSSVDPILVTYQFKSYVGSTGQFSDPTEFVPCPDFADNFNNGDLYSGVNTVLNACVDFSQFQNAIVSFDMIQFRNNAAVSQGNLYSSMLQVKWDGNETGNQVFYGQPEGQIVHHELDLPHFFKGGLEIKFFTAVGQGYLETGNFQTDDVVLLDNLRLKTNTVGTASPLAANRILISPNPAQDNLEIRSAEPLKTLELMGVDGKLLKREAVDGATVNLDLSGLENGVFFLRMQAYSGAWAVRRVVKMKD